MYNSVFYREIKKNKTALLLQNSRYRHLDTGGDLNLDTIETILTCSYFSSSV